MTVQETYEFVKARHFKFLTKNFMAEDIATRKATIFAVQNAWKMFNKSDKRETNEWQI